MKAKPSYILFIIIGMVFCQNSISQDLLAYYPLITNLSDATGNNGDMTISGIDPPDGSLCSAGDYPKGGETPIIQGFNREKFEIDVDFKLSGLPEWSYDAIIMGGHMYRWIGAMVDTSGQIYLVYNNSKKIYSGTTVSTNTWYNLKIQHDNHHVCLLLDDIKILDACIPTLNTGNDHNFTTLNYANGAALNGCIKNLMISNNPPIPIMQTESYMEICEGDFYEFGNQTLITSGQYTAVFESVYGCDSTVILDLFVNPSYTTSFSEAICEGDSMFLSGAWQTNAGVFHDTLLTSIGCDSILETTLTFLPRYFMQQLIEICEGDSIFLEGAYQHENGLCTDLYLSEFGCDSIVITNLVLNPAPVIEFITDTIITDQPAEVILDAGAGFEFYLWHNGSTNQVFSVQDYGWHIVEVTNTLGCISSDSVLVTQSTAANSIHVSEFLINVHPNPNKGTFTLKISGPHKLDFHISLVDLSGREIYQNDIDGKTDITRDIDISPYPKGIYMLNISSDKYIRTEKIILQ